MLDGADFLWTHNGAPICDAPRGVKVLDTPGVHRLAVLVIAKNGQEFRGSTNVTVRDRISGTQSRERKWRLVIVVLLRKRSSALTSSLSSPTPSSRARRTMVRL